MDHLGTFLDEEWETRSRMFFSEDADSSTSSAFWPTDKSFLHPNNSFSNSSVFFPTPTHENLHFDDSSCVEDTNNALDHPMDFCALIENGNNFSVPIFHNVMEDHLGLKGAQKRKFDEAELQAVSEEKKNDPLEAPKKKSRASRDVEKGKKKAATKKRQKIAVKGNDEEDNIIGGPIRQSFSSCSSAEDDSNASQELSGKAACDLNGEAALNSSGKRRASRGAATDPQSLYARRRREKINERLRILQNLVPNGTKVDISTMLEEAVHYVKFLQLQIKLLSSDELWMYAPIAYNGMDIGLYHKLSPTL
ncbi:hypothetical protein NMG60_11031235 [Bertholletia excelsa]